MGAWAAAGAVEDPATSDVRVGPDAEVGDGVYAGGGSLDGTVNAFIPGRSGRRVAGEGFASGLGLLLPIPLGCNDEGISEGPRNEGVAGV